MSTVPLRSEVSDLFRLLDHVPTGIILLDRQGTVVRINPTACERIAQRESQVLGTDFFRDVVPDLESEGLGSRFREAISAGPAALEWDGTITSPRGLLPLWLGIRSFSANDHTWAVMVVEDRAALADEEGRRKRAERLAAVGELAAGVAHEVNNPLASIKSFAQLLSRDANSQEQHRALEIIVQESERIARAVENLLSFARQQGASGREPVNLSEVAARVLDLQRYSLDTAGIEVRQDLDLALSPVMGEAGALQQVVLNLVVNAEQALSTKKGHRLLVVRTRESSEGVLLSVVDNGPGIPRDVLPRIFESYMNAEVHGSGLGLGVSATIIREHGGQIMAESEEGRGAAFFVRLPRAAIGAPTSPVVPQAPAPEPRATPVRPLRVLVADDEPTLRLAISLFLGRRGHHVTQAADAYEALRLAKEQDFDVALVDARMPGDGLQLLEQLEAMPSLAGRTALMTGDLGRARTSQGITTGRPYLIKPFDMTEAVSLIEKLGR
ncbi:MAG: response regulator [Gemmatimonadetes bacterium]|nr:response regulator [Gemmatimonadota bacterium]